MAYGLAIAVSLSERTSEGCRNAIRAARACASINAIRVAQRVSASRSAIGIAQRDRHRVAALGA